MNERQAEKENLFFTGKVAKPWNATEVEEIKEEAKKIRKLGFRAVIVQSGAREWGSGYKVLYADEKYFDYKRAKEIKQRLSTYDSQRDALLKYYQTKLAELNQREKDDKEIVAEAEKTLKMEI